MDSNTENVLEQEDWKKGIESDEIRIDLGRIFQRLLRFWWLIVIATMLGAFAAYGYTEIFVDVKYTSTATVYVKNAVVGGVSNADEDVAKTCIVILKSPDTVSRALNSSDLMNGGQTIYSVSQVQGMISAKIEEEGTGTFNISVSCRRPDHALALCELLVDALGERVQEVINTEMYYSVVTQPKLPTVPSSPNVKSNTMIGAVAGFLVCCLVIAVIEAVNNKIYSDDYLIETYHMPILANIPDFTKKMGGGYTLRKKQARILRLRKRGYRE